MAAAPVFVFPHVMYHKFSVVSAQVDAGLDTLTNTILFLEKLSALHNDKDPVQVMKNQRMTNQADEMKKYLAAVEFSKQVVTQVVGPMREFLKHNLKHKQQLDKDFKRAESNIQNLVKGVNSAKNDAQKAIADLKTSNNLRDTQAVNPKLAAAAAKAKAKAIKSVEDYTKKVQACRTAQEDFNTKELPSRLRELEGIEKFRLKLLAAQLTRFKELHQNFVAEVHKFNDSLAEVTPNTDADSQIRDVMAKWKQAHGSPTDPVFLEYELKCTAEDVSKDIFESDVSNVLPPLPLPSGSTSSSSSSASPSSASLATFDDTTDSSAQSQSQSPSSPSSSSKPPPRSPVASSSSSSSSSSDSFSSPALATTAPRSPTGKGGNNSPFNPFGPAPMNTSNNNNPFGAGSAASGGRGGAGTQRGGAAGQYYRQGGPGADADAGPPPVPERDPELEARLAAALDDGHDPDLDNRGPPPPPPVAAGPKVLFQTEAIADYTPDEEDVATHVTLHEGDVVKVYETDEDWWYGEVGGKVFRCLESRAPFHYFRLNLHLGVVMCF